jgi:hypothetical protein
MAGAAVHFRGIDSIMQAYDFNHVAAWAIVCGGDIPFQFVTDSIEEGAQALRECLEMLKRGHSAARYSLRCYYNPPEHIDNKTPFNLSCQFTLFADEESGSISGLHHVREIFNERLDKIEAQLNGQSDGEPKGLGAQLGSLLARPEILGAIAQRVFGLVDKFLGGVGVMATTRPAAMAGVPGPEQSPDQGYDNATTLYQKLPDQERMLFDQAIEILLQRDPEIGTHLSKLAVIARDNPGKYSMYASML